MRFPHLEQVFLAPLTVESAHSKYDAIALTVHPLLLRRNTVALCFVRLGTRSASSNSFRVLSSSRVRVIFNAAGTV